MAASYNAALFALFLHQSSLDAATLAHDRETAPKD
jgi:hypothetical protein